jgi:Fe-S cluster assembly protein SufD
LSQLASLQGSREAAVARRSQVAPELRREANKYTSYRALEGLSRASASLICEGAELLDLEAAMKRDPERVKACLGSLATGPWADTALASKPNLAVLWLSPGDETLQVSLRGQGAGQSHQHLLLLSDPDCQRSVHLELLDDASGSHHLNLVIEAHLAESSRLDLSVSQAMSSESYVTATWAFRLAKKANLHAVWMDFGAALARHDLQVDLAEPQARAELAGLMLPKLGQHHDQHLTLYHGASDTHSQQLFKGLVGARGRSVFSGRVEIKEGAAGCSSHQLCRGILLGDGAEFDARPQLLICIDAVEASHGASCGAMDEKSMFFLRSRGLDELAAKQLLAEAFAGEVIELLSDSSRSESALESVRSMIQGIH